MSEPQEIKKSYSVWAIPPDHITERLKKIMLHLRSEFLSPEFEPHITLVGAIELTESDAVKKFKSAWEAVKSYNVTVTSVSTGTFRYQCVFLLLNPSPQPQHAISIISIISMDPDILLRALKHVANMERETMRENMELELEEGEIPPSPTKVEKKLGDQVNVFADSFDTEKRRVDNDKGKRKLEECSDGDEDYHYDNKKQKKAVVKGKKNNKKVGKGAVIRTKEKAPEPLMPKGMKDIINKYVLITWWNDFVAKHRLHEGQTVEIWSFRDLNQTLCFAINIRHDGASKKEASTSSPAFTNGASTGGHGGNDDGAITIKASTSRDHGVGGGNCVDVVPNGASTDDGACGSSGGGAVTNEAITIDQGNPGGNGGGSIITNGASTSDDGNCGGDATLGITPFSDSNNYIQLHTVYLSKTGDNSKIYVVPPPCVAANHALLPFQNCKMSSDLHLLCRVLETSANCSQHFGYLRSTPYMPHASLLYADLTEVDKQIAKEKAEAIDAGISGLSFQISRLALYETDTEDKTLKSWKKIADCELV
ncbi:hypothetical protein IFM89_019478 [Coptis chinensis]|uniref:Cyclic phosphodiesterase n=1 Tax=Coptis chinensis TaxID=261450 RepID=A0A835LE61_9MAGN|nr:hypothetical protein IFM89_019478 [Coptis chinensis]